MRSPRDTAGERRAMLVFAIIVAIGIILLAYQYWG
jgi:hypothetical protein